MAHRRGIRRTAQLLRQAGYGLQSSPTGNGQTLMIKTKPGQPLKMPDVLPTSHRGRGVRRL